MNARIIALVAAGLTACGPGRPPPPSPLQLASAGCWASAAGWWFFGDTTIAGDTALSWLELRGDGGGRLFGWITDYGRPEDWSGHPVRWKADGDSIRVGWRDGLSGAEYVLAPDGDVLRGRGRVYTDEPGIRVPAAADPTAHGWGVRARRTDCARVPGPP